MRIPTRLMAFPALLLTPLVAVAQQPGQAGAPAAPAGQPVINLPGPIDSPQDILESARMAFVLADADGNGLISQQEATDAATLLVGGLFFRADLDGDGIVTQEEANQIREQVFQQRPVLRFVFDRANRDNTPEGVEPEPGTTPDEVAQAIGGLIDTNRDSQIQAAEVRQIVQTGVQALFNAGDIDRDGQLSPAELNATMYGAIRAGFQVAFDAADKDNTGFLTKEQFAEALVQPSYTVFDILDRDLDGRLTPEELEMAAQIAISELDKLTIDIPRNSPANVISSGRLPQGADLSTPAATNQPAAGTTPAPGQPAPAAGQAVQPPARTLPAATGTGAPQPR